VSPGKGGLGTFAPLLDQAGNSVKGQLVAKFLSQRLGMDLLSRSLRYERIGTDFAPLPDPFKPRGTYVPVYWE
jgi:hypothetical protein